MATKQIDAVEAEALAALQAQLAQLQEELKTERTKREEAEAKAAKKTGGGIPGVSTTKGRPYYAGLVIAKHGLDAGVTEAMAHEVNALVGTGNTRESLFALRNAWHAIKGCCDEQARVEALEASKTE